MLPMPHVTKSFSLHLVLTLVLKYEVVITHKQKKSDSMLALYIHIDVYILLYKTKNLKASLTYYDYRNHNQNFIVFLGEAEPHKQLSPCSCKGHILHNIIILLIATST